MATFSRLHKIALVGLGALGGSLAYYSLNSAKNGNKHQALNSWTTNFTPSVQWDNNWDHRDPSSLVKPVKLGGPEEENRFNEELEKCRSKATRHLFLVRHGQYNLDGATDKERVLTDLGRHQADLTGRRLKQLDIKWDTIVRSTMTRAQETAKIIQKHLPTDVEVKDCQLIEEGAPIPPEPPVGHWRPEAKVFSPNVANNVFGLNAIITLHDLKDQLISLEHGMQVAAGLITGLTRFFQDSARIEAGFRRYFYRAPPEQNEDSYMLMVCHANVIRFFVCKALQFPPEGWLRMSLNHGSITWLSILPNGNVVLRGLGDTGYMEPSSITSRGGGRKKRTKKHKSD